MPEISVIIPVYNAEKYLPAALDSVLAQSFTDFEVLCVNDGSTDSSPAILDAYAAKDSRIRVIHRKKRRRFRFAQHRIGCGRRKIHRLYGQ